MPDQRRNKRPRILHILGNSKYGGGSVVVLALARMAREMGCEVEILTTDKVFQKVLEETGIGVLDLDVIWRDIRPLRDLKGLVRLSRFLRSQPYDLIHTHTSKGGFVGRLAAKSAGMRRIIHTVHGFAFHEESSKATVLACSVLEKIAGWACDTIVTVSEFHADWAKQLKIASREKFVAIPNGLGAERIEPTLQRHVVRESLDLRPDEFVMLSVVRLAPTKGIEYLLQAISEVKRQIKSPFRLLLAGTGPMATEYKNLTRELGIEDWVQFLGFRTDVGNLLSACDTVVLPSLKEGLSISLLEAMAAKRSIITTTIGSNVEVTRNGLAAKLVAPKDVNALATAIVDLATNSGLRADLATKAREVYETSYTENQMLNAYRHLYKTHLEMGEQDASVRRRAVVEPSLFGRVMLTDVSRGDEAR